MYCKANQKVHFLKTFTKTFYDRLPVTRYYCSSFLNVFFRFCFQIFVSLQTMLNFAETLRVHNENPWEGSGTLGTKDTKTGKLFFATTVIKVTKMHLSGMKPCILAFTMKLLIIASCCSLLLSDATLLKIDRIFFLLKETFAIMFVFY